MLHLRSRNTAEKRTSTRQPGTDSHRMIDWRSLFRHDVFISYRRSESAAYAAWLYQRLSEADLSCFLDEHEAVAGDPLTPAIEKALDRARVLIVVITGQVYKSDWVGREVERFAPSGRPIVPIRIGEPMNKAAAMDTPLRAIFERDVLWIDEAAAVSGEDAPSDPTVARVRGLFRFRRSRLLLRLSTVGTMALLAGIAVWALVERFRAIENQKIALSQELSVRSELALPTDPNLSLDLALQATRSQATAPSETALRRALRDSYLAAVIGGSDDPVQRVTFSRSGKKLATLHRPWRIEIRDASNFASVVQTAGVSTPDTAVVGVEFALQDTVLLTWDMKGRIEVWDSTTGQKLRSFGVNAFRTDTAWIAPEGAQIISLANPEATKLAFWDIASGRQIRTLDIGGDTITAVAFSADSKLLILATINPEATASSDYAGSRTVIHVIDRASGGELVSLPSGQRRIDQIAVSTAGDLIASAIGGVGPPAPTGAGVSTDQPMLSLRGHNDDALKIWRRDGTAYHQVFTAESYQNPRVHVTADQRFVLFADENDSKVISTRPVGPYQTFTGHRGYVTMLVTDSTSSLAATASADGSARIWSVSTGLAICEFRGHVGTVRAVSLSADGRWAATVGLDGSARVWDMQCAQGSAPLLPALVGRSTPHSAGRSMSALGAGWVARSPTADAVEWLSFDGTRPGGLAMTGAAEAIVGISDVARRVAMISPEGQVRVVDTDRSTSMAVGTANPDFVFGAMSGDGTLFVRGNGNGQVQVYDVGSGAPRISVQRDASPAPPVNLVAPPLPPWLKPVRADGSIFVAGVFDPHDQRLALSSRADVELRSVIDGALIARLKSNGEPIQKMLFSPDGSQLLTLAYGRVRGSGEAPRLWSTVNGRMIATLDGSQGVVASAAFTPDGLRLLTSSTDGHLRLWDTRHGALIGEAHLPANTRVVRAIALVDSGDFAAIGGDDGRLFVVALGTLDVLLDLKLGERGVRDLRFAPGSQLLAALLDDDSVVRYRCDLCASRGKLIELAETRLKVYRSARGGESPVAARDTSVTIIPSTR